MKESLTSHNTRVSGLYGSGEMAERIKAYDWSVTPLGAVSEWPKSFTVLVNQMLLSASPIVILWQKTGIILYNDAFIPYTGKNQPVLLGRSCEEAWPEAVDITRHILKTCFEGKPLILKNFPFKAFCKDYPEDIWMNMDCSPVFNDIGIPAGVFIIQHDVTPQIIAEQGRKKAEERFKTIADEAPAFIFMSGENANLEYANKTFLDFTGLSLNELKGQGSLKIIHPDDLDFVIAHYEHAYKHQKPYSFEIRQKSKDGSYNWFLYKGLPRFFPTGEFAGVMGIGIDINDIKEAEAALKESNERFHALADNISQLAWMADNRGYIFWYNKRWLDYTGISLKEMETAGWKNVIHPDHVQGVVEKIKYCFSKGEAWEDTFPIRNKEGEYRWFLSRAVPIKDENGNVKIWFGTNTDVTVQKIITEQLEHKNKQLTRINNDLDNFVYTASHDLKAPINNIEGLMNVLNRILAEANIKHEKIRPLTKMIQLSIDRFKNTIKDLTEVAKVQSDIEEDQEKIEFKEMLEEVKLNIRSEINKTNAIITDDFSKVPLIYFSKKNLRSIIYNLLSNAIKYRSPNRRPEIKISTSLPDEEHILLIVKDNGLGIREDDKHKIFTMFKRLHQHREGTGIGLAIVKKIIDNNGGKIEVESRIGEGTTFKVYFKV